MSERKQYFTHMRNTYSKNFIYLCNVTQYINHYD